MNPVIGQTVTLQATFRDAAGALVDPVVTLTVEDPNGAVTTPATTNPSVGVFQADVTLDVAGYWSYRFSGVASGATTVCEGEVCVDASKLVSV